MNYETSEQLATKLANDLVRIYFSGVDRKKVSPEEMLRACPHFIVDTWDLILNKTLEIQTDKQCKKCNKSVSTYVAQYTWTCDCGFTNKPNKEDNEQ